MKEAILCHFLILRAWLSVVGKGIDADATSWNEDTSYLNVLGFHESNEVLHDDVDAIFVETAMIAEAEKVEF